MDEGVAMMDIDVGMRTSGGGCGRRGGCHGGEVNPRDFGLNASVDRQPMLIRDGGGAGGMNAVADAHEDEIDAAFANPAMLAALDAVSYATDDANHRAAVPMVNADACSDGVRGSEGDGGTCDGDGEDDAAFANPAMLAALDAVSCAVSDANHEAAVPMESADACSDDVNGGERSDGVRSGGVEGDGSNGNCGGDGGGDHDDDDDSDDSQFADPAVLATLDAGIIW